VCNVGEIPAKWLKFPKEAPDHALGLVNAAAVVIKTCGLLVDDQPGLTADQICSRIRQAHLQEPLKLAVVDHLMLVSRPHKNEAVELGQIAIAFKNLAKELKITVLLLLQLNRAGKTDRPELSAIRNSGEIEEALDTCVMVYRDEYYRPDSPLKGYAEFIVRKQRQGERNVTAWAKSMLSHMRFDSCDAPERPTEQAATHGGRGGFASSYGQGRQSRPIPRTGSDN
jgi:replicative DNA helicase